MNLRLRRWGLAGFTLLEALVALLLSCLMVSLALGTLSRHRDMLRRLGERADRLAAARTARYLLGAEARAAAGEGAWSVGEDSLALRSFRGYALACGAPTAERELQVSAVGVRAPDPDKDSVLLLRASGGSVALALLERSASSGPCPAVVGPVQRWALSGPVPGDVVVARWFERGSYHLTAKALRYRRGLGGRQPLTPEVLATPGSGFRPAHDGRGVEVLLETEGSESPPWAFRMEASR